MSKHFFVRYSDAHGTCGHRHATYDEAAECLAGSERELNYTDARGQLHVAASLWDASVRCVENGAERSPTDREAGMSEREIAERKAMFE